MEKCLYYYCDTCKVKWTDKYYEEYGECDSECVRCCSNYTPFTNEQAWRCAMIDDDTVEIDFK